MRHLITRVPSLSLALALALVLAPGAPADEPATSEAQAAKARALFDACAKHLIDGPRLSLRVEGTMSIEMPPGSPEVPPVTYTESIEVAQGIQLALHSRVVRKPMPGAHASADKEMIMRSRMIIVGTKLQIVGTHRYHEFRRDDGKTLPRYRRLFAYAGGYIATQLIFERGAVKGAVSDFSLGKADGGNQVLRYTLSQLSDGDAGTVLLTIDTRTNLPVARTVRVAGDGAALRIVERYTEVKTEGDPPKDAFDTDKPLPKEEKGGDAKDGKDDAKNGKDDAKSEDDE